MGKQNLQDKEKVGASDDDSTEDFPPFLMRLLCLIERLDEQKGAG